MLLGPNSFFPLGALCKKQGCQSLSTPEAEVVALTVTLKEHVYPMLSLFEHVLRRKKCVPIVYEDNESTQKILRSGKVEKAMGHVGRTHEIVIPWTCEQLKKGNWKMSDCHTKAMCADVFTKYFTNPIDWKHALNLLSVFPSIKCRMITGAAQVATPAVGITSEGALTLPGVQHDPPESDPDKNQHGRGQAMGGVIRHKRQRKNRSNRSGIGEQAASAIAVTPVLPKIPEFPIRRANAAPMIRNLQHKCCGWPGLGYSQHKYCEVSLLSLIHI